MTYISTKFPLLVLRADAIGFSGYVDNFLSGYGLPEFVLSSISQMLPDVLRDGAKLAYIIASEGIVLLKNNGVLPLNRDAKIAVWEVLSTGLGDITYMLDV